ncbi:hypothetical protein D9M71_497970 [compost metagenome]
MIRGVLLRQPALIRERHQLAAGLAHSEVELLGVGVWLACHMLKARPPAIHGLQQIEITDVGDTGLA